MVNCNFELLKHHPQVKKLIVAFSGGLDSTVLLHLLHKQQYKITAVHVNHNLSPNAATWEQHCKEVCEQLNIEYHSHQVYCSPDVAAQRRNLGIEADARKKRYAMLSQYVDNQTALLTAHHQDDQAETVILQLMRGAGVAGLAAMPEIRPFADGWLYRPLLSETRAALEAYADTHQLSWITDESNFDVSFERNFIRHELLPFIETRWPAAQRLLNRTAEHAKQADIILSEVAATDLDLIAISSQTVDINKLIHLSAERQHNVIRFWLKKQAAIIPEQKQLQEIFDNIIHAKNDAMPLMQFAQWELRRYKNTLYLLQPQETVTTFNLTWDVKQDLVLPQELGTLKVADYEQFIALAPFTVCTRQPGIKLLIDGREGHHKLKHLFQEWEVPVWERERIVFVLADDRLLSAAPYYFEGDALMSMLEKSS